MKQALLVVLLVAGCGGGSGTDLDAGPDATVCEANAAPDAPTIDEPVEGRIDVVAADMVIGTSPFVDPDAGDAQGGAEYEIWSVDATGAPATRVWHASLDLAVTQVALADGTFDWAMTTWTDYVVRARYRDDRGPCSAWSDWSADRAFRTDDGSSYLFDPNVVRNIYLTIPQTSWDAINAQALPPGCVPFSRDYYPATLTFEGQVFDDVGLHVKGGCGSARTLDGKASFKVKLDWDDPDVPGCPMARKLDGQKHLTLNAGVQDPTLEHERLGYPLEQEFGVPTPRAASVRLYVNGVFWGVYTDIETIDRRFLERWFDSNKGMLYEGTYWCDLLPQNVPPTTDDSYCLTREFSESACSAPPGPGDDPLDYDLLRTFVQQLQDLPAGGYYPEVEAFVDFDTFLSQWAVESVISHWDAYEFQIMNNYRVYHDPSTGRWTVIPTGIDQTFGGDQDPWNVGGILAARCLQEPDCEAAFADRLRTVAQRFADDDMAARAQAIYDQISPDVFVDPRKEVDGATYVQAFHDLEQYIADRPARITAILAAHGY